MAFLTKIFSDSNIRKTLSVSAFLASVVIAVIAVFTPPLAIVDSSILYLTA